MPSLDDKPREYECAGLVVRSAIPLAAPLAGADLAGVAPSVEILVGESRSIPWERPSNDVVAEVVHEGVPWSSVCRIASGYLARYFGLCDVEISESAERVVCHLAPEGDRDLLSVLVSGSVVALILAIRGWCVLHASAVEVSGRAVAFAGPSGQGKSTVAALLCAAGAPLIADDVLPVELSCGNGRSAGGSHAPDEVHVWRCASEVRLRPKAAELAERFADEPAGRLTADGRYAVAPGGVPTRRSLLAAVVVPRPSREAKRLRRVPLSTPDATLHLGRSARVAGWQQAAELRKHFLEVVRIVESVPVFALEIPWGPPFQAGLSGELLEMCS